MTCACAKYIVIQQSILALMGVITEWVLHVSLLSCVWCSPCLAASGPPQMKSKLILSLHILRQRTWFHLRGKKCRAVSWSDLLKVTAGVNAADSHLGVSNSKGHPLHWGVSINNRCLEFIPYFPERQKFSHYGQPLYKVVRAVIDACDLYMKKLALKMNSSKVTATRQESQCLPISLLQILHYFYHSLLSLYTIYF